MDVIVTGGSGLVSEDYGAGGAGGMSWSQTSRWTLGGSAGGYSRRFARAPRWIVHVHDLLMYARRRVAAAALIVTVRHPRSMPTMRANCADEGRGASIRAGEGDRDWKGPCDEERRGRMEIDDRLARSTRTWPAR